MLLQVLPEVRLLHGFQQNLRDEQEYPELRHGVLLAI
jgi:hypothetical protein